VAWRASTSTEKPSVFFDSFHHPAICFWRQLPLHMFLRTHAQNRSSVLVRTRTRTRTRTRMPTHAHAHQHHAQAHAHACIMHARRQARINGASARAHTHTPQPKMKSTQTRMCTKSILIIYNFRVLYIFPQIWTGIVGTGKIGQIAAKILSGFSPGRLIGYDVYERCLCVLLWHATCMKGASVSFCGMRLISDGSGDDTHTHTHTHTQTDRQTNRQTHLMW
jgi:hypothetical protein